MLGGLVSGLRCAVLLLLLILALLLFTVVDVFFVSFVQLFFDVSDLNDNFNSALSSFVICICERVNFCIR